MSKKSVLRFTLKELNVLIQDEKARVILQRSIRKLPLQPYCLSDLRGSIHEVLDANLARFDHELKGILLSYKNIKIVKNVANVLYDDSRLYVTIQADFYLFMPEVGCVLRGVVNKRSADHIGCLVHKAFNVSIPRPECEADEEWQGYYVEIGQEITFRVLSLDLTGSLPYMLGCLLEVGSVSSDFNETSDEQKSTVKEEKIFDIHKLNESLEQYADLQATFLTKELKKKKKHKKYTDLERAVNATDPVCMKHERSDSILEDGDKGHQNNEIVYACNEDGNALLTTKKKKRKHRERTAAIKLEEQAYGIGNERGTRFHNQQEEDQHVYEEQILHNKKPIDNSYQLFDHLNSSTNLKKKKRSYSEAFYDNENSDEHQTFNPQNESVQLKKKKKKKEKHSDEMSHTGETGGEDCSMDTSQELTYQDKKRKKKKKRDATEEVSADLREENEFYRTDAACTHMTHANLTISPGINNKSEDLVQEMPSSQEHFKKSGKRVKPHVIPEIVTSTPVEHRTKKENSFSSSLSNFSVIKGTDSQSDIKQKSLLETVNQISLRHSPYLKTKQKMQKESSLAEQSDTSPVKVKRLKKEKSVRSSQQNSDKEEYSHSESRCVYYQPESSLPWSDMENSMKETSTHPSSYNTSLNDLQVKEYKYKKGDMTEISSSQFIKNDLESSVESKLKMSKRENRLALKKKDSTGNDVRKTVKSYNNAESDGDHDENDEYHLLDAQCGEFAKGKVSRRLAEYTLKIKKQPSVTEKNITSLVSDTASLICGRNTLEKGNSSHDDNKEKAVPKLNRILSLEISPKHSRSTEINLSSSQKMKNSDRAYSPDSGLSLSAASCDRDPGNSIVSGGKTDADSKYRIYCREESPKEGRLVKEQVRMLPKTPKRKRSTDAEESSCQLTVKHRIKKEKGSPICGPSSSRKCDTLSPLEEDSSLESKKMKLLSALMKKMEDGNKKECSKKDEGRKPQISSAGKVKQQSSQEQSVSDSDIDVFLKSKKIRGRKESKKSSVIKNSIAKVDTVQQVDVTSNFEHFAVKDSTSSTVNAENSEVDGNRKYLKEGSPVPIPAKIAAKTSRRKSSTGTEGSSSKSITKTVGKIKKEKESPKKRKVISSFESDNREVTFLAPGSPNDFAQRLLDNFVGKNQSNK